MIIKAHEARLTNEFTQDDVLSGVVHSKFKQTVNLKFKMPDGSGRMLTIAQTGLVGLPDSLVVGQTELKRILQLPVHSTVKGNGFRLIFPHPKIELRAGSNCIDKCRLVIPEPKIEKFNLPNLASFPQTFNQYKLGKQYTDGFSYFPAAQQEQMNSSLRLISQAWGTANLEFIESILSTFVGMGIGLTPSFDDALIGIMAVFEGAWQFSKMTESKNRASRYEGVSLQDLCQGVRWKRIIARNTTDVSAKYLHCALEGYFSDNIVKLIRMVFSEQYQDLLPVFDDFSEYGASSGMDMLYGASIACDQINHLIEKSSTSTA